MSGACAGCEQPATVAPSAQIRPRMKIDARIDVQIDVQIDAKVDAAIDVARGVRAADMKRPVTGPATGRGYRGILPCLRGRLVWRLLRSVRSDRMIVQRVSRGRMISSM